MATYQPETPTETGLAATYRAAANGDKVPGGVVLHVKNGNAAALTLTITTPKAHADLAVSDRVISGIPATTGERFIRIPNNDVYVDPADGLVTLATFSVTASVTYAVLNMTA